MIKASSRFLGLWVLAALCACGDTEPPPTPPQPPQAPPQTGRGTRITLSTGTFTPVNLSQTSIGRPGGRISVMGAGSALEGLEIEVPEAATEEDISFSVSHADGEIKSGLPEGAVLTSKVIRIETSGSERWNRGHMFSLPVKVTLPYASTAGATEAVHFYTVDSEGKLEPAGLEQMDGTRHRLSFYTRTFANSTDVRQLEVAPAVQAQQLSSRRTFAQYVAIGVDRMAAWRESGKVIDTGFRPAANGWYIPNYGSYYKASRGGSCFGFVGAAKHYYKRGYQQRLVDSYRDTARTAPWFDDAVAIEYTSRVHNGLADIWQQFVDGEVNIQQESSSEVANSLVGAIYVTGLPALLYIQQVVLDRGIRRYTGAHAISVHRVDIERGGRMTLHVYDPNHPGDDSRRISYAPDSGFATYLSGTNSANSGFRYNFFKHIGFHVGLSDAALDALKSQADRGFAGDSVFPKITITSVRGVNQYIEEPTTEGTTATGEHRYITNQAVVRIRGTILGGLAQNECCVVSNANIYINGKRFFTRVDNRAGGGTGMFMIDVPVAQGDNEVVILASDNSESITHWAAFKRDIITSNAQASALTVALSWGKNYSDIDLYVKEPDDAARGKTGDTVYFGRRRGVSATSPYLDIDNTIGYGPEHYYAINGMKTRYTDGTLSSDLHGTYRVKVHYFADHDGDSSSTQLIPWFLSYRYLAYCPPPCENPEATGFWVEGSTRGLLTSSRSSNCCSIGNSGPDWSDTITIDYPRPNPNDWVVPPSRDIMRP